MYSTQWLRNRMQRGRQMHYRADPQFAADATRLMNRIAASGYPSRYNDYNSFRNVAKHAAPAAAAATYVMMGADKKLKPMALKQAPPSRIPKARRKSLRSVPGQQKITKYFPPTNIPAHLVGYQRTQYTKQYVATDAFGRPKYWKKSPARRRYAFAGKSNKIVGYGGYQKSYYGYKKKKAYAPSTWKKKSKGVYKKRRKSRARKSL